MDRRQFIKASLAAMASGVAFAHLGDDALALPFELATWKGVHPYKKGPAPRPEITAAVDVLVPADPEIPGDFVGSDYGADWVLAASVGDMGQLAMVIYLNRYARIVAGAKFINCTDEERLEAIRAWVEDRENLSPTISEMLTGLLTLSVIGAFEDNTEEERKEVFASMNWWDPEDPAGTFLSPTEGFPDSYMFPSRQKKGLLK